MNKSKLGLECNLHPELAATTIEDSSYLTKDEELWRILESSSLYMLAKRPCILLHNISFTSDRITGKIIQIDTANSLEFDLPLLQEDLIEGHKRRLEIRISYNNKYRQYCNDNGLTIANNDFIDTILAYHGDHSATHFGDTVPVVSVI